jgi:hypothetical protein
MPSNMDFSEFEKGLNEAGPSEARLKQYAAKYQDLQKKARYALDELRMWSDIDLQPTAGVPNPTDVKKLDDAYEDFVGAFEAFLDHAKTAP